MPMPMPKYRGLTLLEVMIATAMFSLLIFVAFSSLQSLRSFTATNVTQVDLQETARHALEKITERMRNCSHFTDSVTGRSYPKLVKSGDPFPGGYSTAAQHAPKVQPKAPPGSIVNGGDPTLESYDIIYRIPGDVDGDGLPTRINPGTQMAEIEFQPQECSLVLAPGPDNQNQIEFRDSTIPGASEIIARNVDRLLIQDYSSDSALTVRQLRVTIFVTRLLPKQGVISTSDPALANQILTVSVSSVIDMRNASDME